MIRLYKKNTTYYKAVSLTVVFLIVMSMLIPMLSIVGKADDKPVVTETENQRIIDFSVRFISGADNIGTAENPQLVWNTSQSSSNHEFVYQADYQISGNGEIAKRKFQIVLPKHIFIDRTGQYADVFDVAFPHETEVSEEDRENEFVYVERENDILIYNRIDINAAQEGSFQFSYKPSRSSFYYEDNCVSDSIEAILDIDRGENEKLHIFTSAPSVKIDTFAMIRSSEKANDGLYTEWSDVWGDPAQFGIEDTELYEYIIWKIRLETSATQPYILKLNDVITGEYGDASFVGCSFNGKGRFTTNTTSDVIWSAGVEQYYVLSKHLKTTYEMLSSYTISNKVTVDLHPYDGIDEDSRSVASAAYNKRPKSPEYPSGHIEFYKYCYDEDPAHKYTGKTVNYQLDDFKTGLLTEISEGLAFRMDQIGYTYEWTLAENAAQEDIDQYGKRRITFSITDDEFYLNDKIKFEDDKIDETPEGTIRLGYQDFEITSISYYSDIKGASWSDDELKFLMSSPEYDESNSLYIYAKFGANDTWQLAGIYHYIDRRGEAVSEMVKSVSDSEIIFKKNACCTGYRIVFANSFYSSLFQVYPKYKIKHSAVIDNAVAQSYRNGSREI